jgi:hypothetical protein
MWQSFSAPFSGHHRGTSRACRAPRSSVNRPAPTCQLSAPPAQSRAKIPCTQEAPSFISCSTIPAPGISAHRRRGSTLTLSIPWLPSPPLPAMRKPRHRSRGSTPTALHAPTQPERRAAAADRRWPRRQPWHSEDRRRRPQRGSAPPFRAKPIVTGLLPWADLFLGPGLLI